MVYGMSFTCLGRMRHEINTVWADGGSSLAEICIFHQRDSAASCSHDSVGNLRDM